MRNHLIGLSFFVMAMAGVPADAQVAVTEEEQLALGQVCVNEGDFGVHRRADCPAIFEALSNFARQRTVTARRECESREGAAREGFLRRHEAATCEEIEVTWLEHARDHSDRVFDRSRTDARAYVAFLTPDGAEPERWPVLAGWRAGADGFMHEVRHVPWERRRDDWLETYALAGRILAGEVEARCDTPPLTWGCPGEGRRDCGDHARAVERGLSRVDCGETANWFYGRP